MLLIKKTEKRLHLLKQLHNFNRIELNALVFNLSYRYEHLQDNCHLRFNTLYTVFCLSLEVLLILQAEAHIGSWRIALICNDNKILLVLIGNDILFTTYRVMFAY
jgi:hypothetical protein